MIWKPKRQRRKAKGAGVQALTWTVALLLALCLPVGAAFSDTVIDTSEPVSLEVKVEDQQTSTPAERPENPDDPENPENPDGPENPETPENPDAPIDPGVIPVPEFTQPVELIAPVEGQNYSVKVTIAPDSGIPADAALTVTPITDAQQYDTYYDTARDALEGQGDGQEKVQELYLFTVSLISNGVDYGSSGRYNVEIVLDQPIDAQPENLRVVQFSGEDVTLLPGVPQLEQGPDNTQVIQFQIEGE